MRRLIMICTLAVLILAVSPAAQAAITGVDLGTAAPPGTLGPYTMTPFPDDPRAQYSIVASVPSPDPPVPGSVDFSIPMDLRTVGSGWATWSHGYTGDVYFTGSAGDPDTVILALPALTGAFYLYAEPNPRTGPWEITATAQDGTFITQMVHGDYGAAGYGFYGTGGDSIVSIRVDYAYDRGFAVGEFGIAVVPVPGAVLLGILGLSVAGMKLRKFA